MNTPIPMSPAASVPPPSGDQLSLTVLRRCAQVEMLAAMTTLRAEGNTQGALEYLPAVVEYFTAEIELFGALEQLRMLQTARALLDSKDATGAYAFLPAVADYLATAKAAQ